MIAIKNSTLMNNGFSESLNKICSMVWGRKIDQEIFKVLDEVTEKQNSLNRLHKKYYADAKINPQKPNQASVDAFNANWEPILEEVSQLGVERISLVLKGDNSLSGMDRYFLREIFDIEHEK